MAKKKKMKGTHLVLLAIVVIIIAIVVMKQKAVVEPEAPEAPEGAAEAGEEQVVEEVVEPAEDEMPLYPDLCYAEGGTPRKESDGCRAGEKDIGDVPGFKVPYICCAD
jgi:hypothetical protein